MWSKKKPLKYRNKPCIVDGIKFHSRREGARYTELKILHRVGTIRDLELQPRFEIIPGGIFMQTDPLSHNVKPERLRPRVYVADFMYWDEARGLRVVEDVKSKVTAKESTYRLKRHLFLKQYGQKYLFIETF